MNSQLKQRDYTWDVLKFFLIVTVILGHFLYDNMKDNAINCIVHNYIYLFHMPLFVFISGFFSRKNKKEDCLYKMFQLLETYIVVQFFYVTSAYFLLHIPFSWRYFYTPSYAAWYLLSLIIWRVLLQIAPEKLLNSRLIVPICITVSLAAGFIPVGVELSIQRTLAFSPFFFCGYYLKKRMGFGLASLKMKCFCVGVIFATFVGSCIFLNRDVSFVVWCSSSYYSPHHSAWTLLLFRTFFLVIAAMMVFCILMVFPKQKNPSIWSRMGEDTLYYYVYHVLVMRVGMVAIRHFDLSLAFPAMLLYTILTVVLINFLVKISFFRNILNPISSYVRLINTKQNSNYYV